MPEQDTFARCPCGQVYVCFSQVHAKNELESACREALELVSEFYPDGETTKTLRRALKASEEACDPATAGALKDVK